MSPWLPACLLACLLACLPACLAASLVIHAPISNSAHKLEYNFVAWIFVGHQSSFLPPRFGQSKRAICVHYWIRVSASRRGPLTTDTRQGDGTPNYPIEGHRRTQRGPGPQVGRSSVTSKANGTLSDLTILYSAGRFQILYNFDSDQNNRGRPKIYSNDQAIINTPLTSIRNV